MDKSSILGYREELMLTGAQIRVAMASVLLSDLSICHKNPSCDAIFPSRSLLREQLKKNNINAAFAVFWICCSIATINIF